MPTDRRVLMNRVLPACVFTPVMLLSAGCPTLDVGALLTNLPVVFTYDRVLIEVINQTGYESVLDLRVDGVDKTIRCAAAVAKCQLLLDPCPATIELLQENRYDTDQNHVGRFDFEGNDRFIFEQGEFTCGGTIRLLFTDTGVRPDIF